jgi:AcrR family transcriptional regulator
MTSRRTGPVRSPAAHAAVLDAASRLFIERGYDHLTMEAIAAEAKVGKATLYRWWGSKSEVVAECLLSGRLTEEALRLPDTGDLRSDLRDWLGRVFAFATSVEGEALVRSLIAAAADNAEVGKRLRDSLGGGASVVGRLRIAQNLGQISMGRPLDELSEALIGAILIRALARQLPDGPAIDRLLDALAI